jgi:predicted negative regulator of RcsB-dependent stress response
MFSNTTFYFFINIVVYLILIYGLHICWNYIQDNYSKKKTKDLVNSQIHKYKTIIDEIQRTNQQSPIDSGSQILSLQDKELMETDLTSFMDTI